MIKSYIFTFCLNSIWSGRAKAKAKPRAKQGARTPVSEEVPRGEDEIRASLSSSVCYWYFFLFHIKGLSENNMRYIRYIPQEGNEPVQCHGSGPPTGPQSSQVIAELQNPF